MKRAMTFLVTGRRGEHPYEAPNHTAAFCRYLIAHTRGVGYHTPVEVAPGIWAATTTAGWTITARPEGEAS